VWDPKHHLALAARWSALEDDRVTMRRLVGVERSRDAEEVASRFRSLVTPTINLVAADVDGATIYQAVGLVPRRGFIAGPGPLPDDGRHEWAGFIPADSMPAWRPAPDGFAVNGNNRPAHLRSPDAWPRFDWAQDRAARMSQRLAGDRSVTAADLMSVQNDVYSRASARQVPALLAAIAPREHALPARARAALDSLRAWDFVARRDRVGPTIARAWWNAWVRRDTLGGVPGLALALLTGEAHGPLRAPGGAIETPADAAAGALATAIDTLAAKLGPDPARWTWARAHRAHFQNPLAEHGRGARFEPSLVPADGDGSTVSVGGSTAPWSFAFTHGPAFRHVVDLADSLTSWVVIPPWNSAAPGGHSADLRSRWADHGYVPLRMDWSRIEREAAGSVAFPAGGQR
jgi:penicillin amidase